MNPPVKNILLVHPRRPFEFSSRVTEGGRVAKYRVDAVNARHRVERAGDAGAVSPSRRRACLWEAASAFMHARSLRELEHVSANEGACCPPQETTGLVSSQTLDDRSDYHRKKKNRWQGHYGQINARHRVERNLRELEYVIAWQGYVNARHRVETGGCHVASSKSTVLVSRKLDDGSDYRRKKDDSTVRIVNARYRVERYARDGCLQFTEPAMRERSFPPADEVAGSLQVHLGHILHVGVAWIVSAKEEQMRWR
ncbi:hypothetical protein C8F01DRAFT_1231611 [Mycena amicta]|nr:hypothetical protein C8F01DRAFT_1231611 [Mycena amicta]